MEKLRVGVIGLTHDHVWDHLPQVRDSANVDLVAAAEQHQALRDRVSGEFDCPVFASREEMFDQVEMDAVYVFCSNLSGAQVAISAAEQGLHVLVEKPMAAGLSDADDMIVAARENGIRLMVNWPFCWWPQMQQALRLAAQGAVGQVWQVKYRAAHAGPRELGCSEYFCDWLFDEYANGGGALMDYCCYGAALARAVLGVPHRVQATTGRLCKEDITVEDNAICVMQYPRAIATAEGSWTQIGKLTSYTTAIYGERGTLLVEPRQGGRLLLADEENPEGKSIDLPESTLANSNATEHFCHGIRNGEPFMILCRDRMARDTQEILEAAAMAAQLHQAVDLPLPI